MNEFLSKCRDGTNLSILHMYLLSTIVADKAVRIDDDVMQYIW